MSRRVISSEEEALRDLSTPLSRPSWLERDHSLPFNLLSGDEFEVFCYLLLRREHPGEEIIYYGKTADLGRDIILRRADGGVELVQCKRYSENVDAGEVRAELAKLFRNVFSGAIPERPVRVSFYVAQDLTSPAHKLLTQEGWVESAEKALTEYLKEAPPPDLLDLARTWWPAEGVHCAPGIQLADRAEHYPELIDKFFRTRKVIDGSMAELREGVKADLREVLKERETLSSGSRASGKTWEDLFIATNKQEIGPLYLNDWPGLTPEERFEAPHEFSAIQESVNDQPLTILIGPPAAGKTFIALQVLWTAFRRGLQIRWIGPTMYVPTDGPIPDERGLPDMRQRVESLATKLGIENFHAPLDHHEFITKNLNPGSTVYIEDPFGKRDEEFAYSLHTYKFFDLDEIVEAISDGAARAGCHILLSSREGLFDRWQAERTKKGLPPLPAKLIRISGESYTHEQLERLAIRLGQARGLEHPENIAFEISYQVEFPYEIESILRALPRDAGVEQAEAEVVKYRDGLKSALQKILVAEDDQEALFLLILASRCIDPKTRYLRLHQALDLSGDAEVSLNRAVERYRAFVVRSPAHRLRAGSMVYGPDSDEVFSPSHPVVDEAIMEYLRSSAVDSSPFLERLACALPKDALDRKSARDETDIALNLLYLGMGCQLGPAKDSILDVLLDRGGLSLDHVRGLMHLWSSLDSAFKDRLFTHLESGLNKASERPARSIQALGGNTRVLLIEAASNLTSVELPAEDAWRLTRLLFRVFDSSDGRGLYTLVSPWSYLFEHLEGAPGDILRALENIATSKPDLFVYILGEIAIAHWGKLPESLRRAFFAESSLKTPLVQEKIMQGIAENWEKAPVELRDLFINNATSEDPKIRAVAMTAAWIYRRQDPVLDKLRLGAANDPEVSIPLGIMRFLGDEAEDRRFALKLLDRADAHLAADMLYDLLGPRGEPLPQWRLDLARECLVRGGDRAWSVLAFLHFREEEAITDPLHDWRDSIAEEPEAIRLGALWAYGRSSGRSPQLTPDEVRSLIKGLRNPSRSLALAYLSAQMDRLPQYLQEFLRKLKNGTNEDGDAVRRGKEKRGSDEGNNPWSFLSMGEQTDKTE